MTTQIKEYSAVEAAIENLAKTYSVVPNVKTDEGLKLCKKQYREIRKYEIELDKKRKELGVEARKHLETINSEAKRIDGKLKEISEPYKNTFEARELELQQQEQARIDAVHARIADIRSFAQEARGKSSEEVSAIIEAVALIEVDGSFEEFTRDALDAVAETKKELSEILRHALESERLEKEREELNEQKRKQEMVDRLNKIRMAPVDCVGESSEKIRRVIARLDEISSDEFGEQAEDASEVIAATKEKIQQILEATLATEERESRVQETAERVEPENASSETFVVTGGENKLPEALLEDLADWGNRHSLTLLATGELEEILLNHIG